MHGKLLLLFEKLGGRGKREEKMEQEEFITVISNFQELCMTF
jgi:hypothetical protein